MVNSPIPTNLAGECRKATKILNSFIETGQGDNGPDSVIPPNILARAQGLAIFTVVKAGFLFSGRAGSGIVVARLPDGSGWSAPSCIATGGMGFGGQIGAEVTDFVVVLNSQDAVKAFSHGGNVTLGGNLSVAAGPVGRNAEAAATVGNMAAIFSYSKTKGLFAGISLEGSAIIERKDANAKFYGRPITAKELLSGDVEPPAAADALYAALYARASPELAQNAPSSGSSAPPPLKKKPTVRPASLGPAAGVATVNTATNAPTMPMPEAPAHASSPTAMAPPPPPPVPTRPQDGIAIAQFDFVGQQEGDLSFKTGDHITVTRKTDSQNDWWTGSCNGREGVFPANYVQLT
ncbi:hypothetical protein SYNPS1DRAFT_13980 [Syncephalis pseudoplumigaleata]|uniref:SH3 domain-containing protein n=1 Tax=Syncephalis pseudoplumigaleata TaxID=1712513 RepID=A0A4P9Z3K2_9FUNG|nr:hypothetical protein SYNPS1DRAFT_13980 [Syncephalis pseudoplumigaleata]|eukprot:RKP26592.1 hypothetical protein SYNPS1DRAFT_13980 [Syncephalis pseudoplumigaleata]